MEVYYVVPSEADCEDDCILVDDEWGHFIPPTMCSADEDLAF